MLTGGGLLQSDMVETQAAVPAAEAQFPWQLKCCSSNGETRLYHKAEKDAKELYFAGACPHCLRRFPRCDAPHLVGSTF